LIKKNPKVPWFSKKFATVCASLMSSFCVRLYILQFMYLQAWWGSLLGFWNQYFF